MNVDFIIGLIIGIAITEVAFCLVSVSAYKADKENYIKLEKERDQWKNEAISATAKLGEIQIKIAQEKCGRCKYEDTEKCLKCEK